MDSQQIRQAIEDQTTVYKAEMMAGSWWHSIDLGDGYVTPGVHAPEELRENFAHFKLPADLTGKRVLDIGCWDGYYSFECERRGAEVVAVDAWTPENFFKAKRALNSRVEFHELSVYDVTSARLGRFDIVLFLGVLYHLRHPLLALEKIAEVTRETLMLESHVVDNLYEAAHPVMEFYEDDELGGQYDNWWGPNTECVARMMRAAGFARCEVLRQQQTRSVVKGHRQWDDLPTEAVPSLRLNSVVNAVNFDQRLPRTGRHALLALSVEGLPTHARRWDTRVEVGGLGIKPVYVGPWGGAGKPGEWQLNVPVPLGLDAGPATVRVWHESKRSNEVEIELIDGTEW